MKNSFLFYAAVLLTSCGPTIRVYTDHDRDVNVLTYSSYTWLDTKEIEVRNNPLYYNELNDKRIKAAVNEELRKHGYNRSDSGARLVVHYHIVVENRATVQVDRYGYRYGSYWMTSGISSYPYQEGTLIIDLMEPGTNLLAWRGWAVAVVNDYTSEQQEALIRKAVEKIFRRYPN